MEMTELQKLSADELRRLNLSLAEWVEIHNSSSFSKEQRILALVKIDDFVEPTTTYGDWVHLYYDKTSTVLLNELAAEKIGISVPKYEIAKIIQDESTLQKMYSLLKL
ncbi:MAG: hypothetical protein WC663_05365 [Patescibacteria group bacterium]|jgi:hypothetical protein